MTQVTLHPGDNRQSLSALLGGGDSSHDHTYAAALVESGKRHKRKAADFYPTPPDVTLALMDFLNLPPTTVVWEPASGDGAMARVLQRRFEKVIASDLRDDDSIYGTKGVDFLATAPATPSPDWIVTNPPFNVAEDFIRKARSVTPNVAMLLKSQYWHAARRLKLFEEHPPAHILALTWRPAFLEQERGRSPLMDVIWVIWSAENSATGETRFTPIGRPQNARPQPSLTALLA